MDSNYEGYGAKKHDKHILHSNKSSLLLDSFGYI